MSGNSHERRLVRRSYVRAGRPVPNTYRRLGDKVVVLGVAERCVDYGTPSRGVRWFNAAIRYVDEHLVLVGAGLVALCASALACLVWLSS